MPETTDRSLFTFWILLREGEMLPRGYGIAWFDHRTAQAWCLPVPLNWCAGIVRRLWHRLQAQWNPSVLDRAFQSGYRAGRWRTMLWAQEEAERIAARMLHLKRIEDEARRSEDGAA